jgi:hypothetical protein
VLSDYLTLLPLFSSCLDWRTICFVWKLLWVSMTA